MRIFITGGTGFIGKYVAEKLGKDENELLLLSKELKKEISLLNVTEKTKIIEGDLSDIVSWKKEVEIFNPEIAIHLAWEGIPDYGTKTSIKNLNYGLNLINMLAEIGCKYVLSAGSCWEYGGQPGELSEETIPKPINAFTAAKNSLHLLGREIAKEKNMQFVWTRFFYVYGPSQKETSLIPYLIKCIKEGKTPEIKNPSAQNDFVYVEDVAEAIALLIEKCRESGVYNIGSGKLTSVQDIIKIIYDYFGFQEQYKNIAPDAADVFSGFWADISKIKNDVGWTPRTDIKEGIKKTIDYVNKV